MTANDKPRPPRSDSHARLRPDRLFNILHMYEDGQSIGQIANHLSVAKTTVKRYLSRARQLRQEQGQLRQEQGQSKASVRADRRQVALLEYQRIQWLQQYHQLRLQRDRFSVGSEGWYSYQQLLDELATAEKS